MNAPHRVRSCATVPGRPRSRVAALARNRTHRADARGRAAARAAHADGAPVEVPTHVPTRGARGPAGPPFDMLHVFYTYPKRVQDTFGIYIRYIKIHVSWGGACAVGPGWRVRVRRVRRGVGGYRV